MREPKKVEGLRPRFTTCPALFRDKSPKGDQTRFVRVKLQRKFGYSFLEIGQKTFRVLLMLEAVPDQRLWDKI
jgi:hypothetical protein